MKNNLHALVIDDEAQVREFVTAALRNDGWETGEAESSDQAFELLHERDWSAVFCDVMLGGADGYSVLRRFKEELPATKVVLMTGHGSAAGALDATAFGAYDYLLKLEKYPWPGNIRELENAVVRAAAMCDGTIRAQDLPERVRNYRDAETSDPNLPADVVPAIEEWTSLATVEGRYVARVLAKTHGNKQAAARLLEVDRKTLDRMIKRHKISLDKATDGTPRSGSQVRALLGSPFLRKVKGSQK